MTATIKLVWLDDMAADIDSLDLMGGLGAATGFVLKRDGWVQAIASDSDTSVQEVFTFRIKGSSSDNLATQVQALDTKIRQVNDWLKNPGVERYQVWLRVKMNNETLERQAMVKSIRGTAIAVQALEAQLDSDVEDYQVAIERTPWWEDPYAYPTTTAKTNINSIGGLATLSETIRGDVPARLAKVSLTPPDAVSPMSDYWLGWKTNRFGVAANFQPVWSIGDSGLPLIADTAQVADGTAYGTNKLQCTFASGATFLARCINQLGGSTGVDADQRGSYTVLLRAKMSDASVARVRIEAGFAPGITLYNPVIRSRQVVSGTAWRLYEVGNVSIPPTRIYATHTLTNFAIQLDAERLSGAGYLDVDCFILIPVDDGMVKLSAPIGVTTTGKSINVFQRVTDDLGALFEEGGNVLYSVIVKPTGKWALPAYDDSPVLVVAAQDVTAGSVKGKLVNMSYTYIPRWRTLRGNET